MFCMTLNKIHNFENIFEKLLKINSRVIDENNEMENN